MSSGDVDDKLGPADMLARLRSEHPDLDAYLAKADDLPIVRATVPYTGGISEDGQTRYISDLLNTDLAGVDISPAIARHESVEWALREFCGIGEDYQTDPRGHRLANRAEYERLNKLFPVTDSDEEQALWDAYDDFMDPQVRKIENAPITSGVPRTLALYAYVGTPLYDKLKEAQQ